MAHPLIALYRESQPSALDPDPDFTAYVVFGVVEAVARATGDGIRRLRDMPVLFHNPDGGDPAHGAN